MIEIFTVDAFATNPFKGNPACVCLSFMNDEHSDDFDQLFQKIAKEMNLSETAFITKSSTSTSTYFLQWFTPKNEVPLCGHATLSTAHILFDQHLSQSNELIFETKHVGQLKVRKLKENFLELDFPQGQPQPILLSETIVEELKQKLCIKSDIKDIQLCKRTKKLLIYISSIDDLLSLKPFSLTTINFGEQYKEFIMGIIVTTNGNDSKYDFFSRYFAPWNGIDEDPVTGGAHTVLGVYWSKLLNKTTLDAYQSSERGGELQCELNQENGRILIRGHAVTVMKGTLFISKE